MPLRHKLSIVDDDKSVRESLKGLVRSLGYEVDVFPSAEEFLRSDAAQATSCVIADIQMPGLSGIELQERMLAEGRSTPIIFMTAYPNERTRAQAVKAGAIAYLDKPCSGDALIASIDEALARKQ